jgi:ribonuclease HII
VVVRRLKDIDHYERQLRAQGFRLLAGVDEAGRGALAGPLVAAAVILPHDFDLAGIEDSKLLTPRQRRQAAARIRQRALAISVRKAMPGRIDRAGLHRTNLALLRRALRTLPVVPEFILTDGTERHWEALWRFGPTPIHRRSFNHVLDPLSPEEYRRMKEAAR